MSDERQPRMASWYIDEQAFPWGGTEEERLQFLLRYAVLAPSSHNTQPWRFAIEVTSPPTIRVLTNMAGWLRVADADKRELLISMGCMLENFLIAARHFGYQCEVSYFPKPDNEEWCATIECTPPADKPSSASTSPAEAARFAAITTRHTNHQAYNVQTIPENDLEALQACVDEGDNNDNEDDAGEFDDLALFLISDEETRIQIKELVIEGDVHQFSNPAYRQELGVWIGKGALGATGMSAKIGKFVVTHINMGKSIAKNNAKLLNSAPVIAVIGSKVNVEMGAEMGAKQDDAHTHIRVGRLFERVALTATARGIATHPMSQPLEVPHLRSKLATLLPTDGGSEYIPQHCFRLGYAKPESKHTPRWAVQELLTVLE
jgi:nitroreductase